MSRKNKIIASLVLLVLSIALIVCGVLLFNLIPEVNTNGYENPKDTLMMTGVVFSFLFAVGALGGSVAFLISALEYDGY